MAVSSYIPQTLAEMKKVNQVTAERWIKDNASWVAAMVAKHDSWIKDNAVDLYQAAYLSRANTWCIGYIGGVPPLLPGEPQDRPGLKIAVATCFEIMARGETKQINPDTGNITEVAPPTGAVKTSTQYKAFDQFVIVREMLRAYKIVFEDQTSKTDRGVKFL